MRLGLAATVVWLASCSDQLVVVALPPGELYVAMRGVEGGEARVLTPTPLVTTGPSLTVERPEGERLAILVLAALATPLYGDLRASVFSTASAAEERTPLARRDGRLVRVTSIGGLGPEAQLFESDPELGALTAASSAVSSWLERGVDAEVPLTDAACEPPSFTRFTAEGFNLGAEIGDAAHARIEAISADRVLLIGQHSVRVIDRGALAPTAAWSEPAVVSATSATGERVVLLVDGRDLVWLQVSGSNIEQTARVGIPDLGAVARDVRLDDAGRALVLTVDGSIFATTATTATFRRRTPPAVARDEYQRLLPTGNASEPWILVGRTSLTVGDPFRGTGETLNYEENFGAGVGIAGVSYSIADGQRELWVAGRNQGLRAEVLLREQGGAFRPAPMIASGSLDGCLASDMQISSRIHGLAVLDTHALLPLGCGLVAAIRRSDGCAAPILAGDARPFVAIARGPGGRTVIADERGAIWARE